MYADVTLPVFSFMSRGVNSNPYGKIRTRPPPTFNLCKVVFDRQSAFQRGSGMEVLPLRIVSRLKFKLVKLQFSID